MTPKWYLLRNLNLTDFVELPDLLEIDQIEFPPQIIPKYKIHIQKHNQMTPKWYLLKNLDLTDFVDLADILEINPN